MSASPGSRLSDDLYSLYLAGLGWLLLPMYGDVLAEVLPSDFATIEPGVNAAVTVGALSAIWTGYRGGPLAVSRAGVLHELASNASRRAMLYPRLLRQMTARSAIAAIGATILLALSTPGAYTLGSSVTISVVAALAMALVVAQSLIWHLVFSTTEGRQAWFVGLVSLGPVIIVGLALTGTSLFGATGLLALLGLTALSIGLAVIGLDWVPVGRIWSRARALETMRSAMQTVDFQQMLLDMRRASDRPSSKGMNLAQPWMPTFVWRQLAALQHGLSGHLARLALASATIVALLALSDPTHGVVALALAGCVAIIGFDLAVPLAATADHLPFLVHYRNGSSRVLGGQMLVAITITMAIAALLTSWLWSNSPEAATGTVMLFGIGVLAALMQARIGSPDVASLASKFGASAVGPMLWGRALSGPILLLGATISISHQYFRPDGFATIWSQVTLVVAVALALVAIQPLERSLR